MTRLLTASSLALALVAAAPAAALAQSYTAPAGIPALAAPGSSAEQGNIRNSATTAPGGYDSLTTGSVTRQTHHNTAIHR